MLSTEPRLTTKTGQSEPILAWIFAAVLGSSLLAAMVFSVVNGPKVRAAAEAALAQEDQAVCAKLGIGPGTSRFTECAATLSVVRTSYARRNEQSVL